MGVIPEKLKKIARIPRILVYILAGYAHFLPDVTVIKLQYWAQTHKKIDFKNPKTFNEKIQWIKLFDRNPLYSQLSDKYEAREFISKTIGDQYLVPLLGVWDRFEDIDFTTLPKQFVLKCNHDCGSVIFCRDKSNLDIKKTKRWFRAKLKRNYYSRTREWQYKDIKPKILAEKYLEDTSGSLNDYKVHCFNGIPRLIQVDFDRFISHKRNIYTPDWELLKVSIEYPADWSHEIIKPGKLNEMVSLSKRLSEQMNVANVRVDWYLSGDALYIGELTFTHGSGTEKITPSSFAEVMGNWIELPMKL